jgi:hypothetical protein
LEVVESVINTQGRAAAKLEMRFRNVVACRTGRDGQRYMQYMHVYAFICIYMLSLQLQGNAMQCMTV